MKKKFIKTTTQYLARLTHTVVDIFSEDYMMRHNDFLEISTNPHP